jgi:hypothetical protein
MTDLYKMAMKNCSFLMCSVFIIAVVDKQDTILSGRA